MLSTSHFTIHIFVLDEQSSQIKRIFHFLEGFLHGHTFIFADFVQHVSIEIFFGVVHRVDDVRFCDVFETPFSSLGLNVGLVAQQCDSSVTVLNDDVRSS